MTQENEKKVLVAIEKLTVLTEFPCAGCPSYTLAIFVGLSCRVGSCDVYKTWKAQKDQLAHTIKQIEEQQGEAK